MHGGDSSLASSSSRPTTPESSMTNSLDNATAHINDLTAALANFSRVPSPEPQTSLTCCCGREDCDNAKVWMNIKSNLENRLVLSAEIGQALLQRHEAYVKRLDQALLSDQPHNVPQLPRNGPNRQSSLTLASLDSTQEDFPDSVIIRLTEEKSQLEKKLNQALVNNEVTEVSNRTILQELQEAQTTISRLTAHHARSIGWDTKLSAALKERDDMQQERDAESHRARLAESRFIALKDRTTKLQAEVRRLQRDLEERRQVRTESSGSTIRDAQTRLESLQRQIGQSHALEQSEFSHVVQSLVDDNTSLKKDNEELQQLLEGTRQELSTAQEELDEHRALIGPASGTRTPHRFKGHGHTSSMPSNALRLDSPTSSTFSLNRRSSSVERKNRRYLEPIGSETDATLSPAETLASSRYPPSPLSLQVEAANDDPESPEQPMPHHRSLLLLSRSKGVQTDPSPPFLLPVSPSPQPTPSPHDPRSESSSFSSEISSNSGPISLVIERIGSLLTRITQADALTLTNRLRRQNLAKGADISHLSRTTVSTIIGEVNALRASFRPFLEDERTLLPCTRKDVRSLLRLFKDVFAELGELRVTVNDVILDPSIAPKLSEWALDPVKAEQEKRKLQGGSSSGTSVGGWIAPISKFFTGSASATSTPPPSSGAVASLTRSISTSANSPRSARVVPKIAPATSSSNTTVNVEFTGAGPGRSVASTISLDRSNGLAPSSAAPSGQPSSVLSIFAGAPGRVSPDPWVVLPRTGGERRQPAAPSFRRATLKPGANMNRMSRNLDAVIDVSTPISSTIEEETEARFDISAPIVPRTLRRRGMSDSSMHSTFTSHAVENLEETTASSSQGRDGWPMIQAISKRVQSLRPTTSRESTPKKSQAGSSDTGSISRRFPGSSFVSSWQPSFDIMTSPGEDVFRVGSLPTGEYLSPTGTSHSRLSEL